MLSQNRLDMTGTPQHIYECDGTGCTKYIFGGSNRIALKSSLGTYYYHTDHLGSSSVITSAGGSVVREMYYLPFGAESFVGGDTVVKHKFTGQELDGETGLYYYGARYYDPSIGRFISADSIVPNFADPQSLNRYSYVRNNPIIYTDPTGHFGIIESIILGAVIGGASSAATGGDIGMGMLTGAIGGAIFFGAGEIIGNAAEACHAFTAIQEAGIHAGAGAISGGINTAIGGGDVGSGMLIDGISGGMGKFAGGIVGHNLVTNSLVGGVTGGIAAEMSGGKFGEGFFQGARTAAFGYLFNHLWHHPRIGLVYHRHGNNKPNYGIEGETGTVTHENYPRGETEAFDQAMRSWYLRALQVQATIVTGGLFGAGWGGFVYDVYGVSIDILTGSKGDLPIPGSRLSIPDAINPDSAW